MLEDDIRKECQMNSQDKVIKPKVGLLELAKQLGNVSQACKIMGYSRDTFYRFKEAFASSPLRVSESGTTGQTSITAGQRMTDDI